MAYVLHLMYRNTPLVRSCQWGTLTEAILEDLSVEIEPHDGFEQT